MGKENFAKMSDILRTVCIVHFPPTSTPAERKSEGFSGLQMYGHWSAEKRKFKSFSSCKRMSCLSKGEDWEEGENEEIGLRVKKCLSKEHVVR